MKVFHDRPLTTLSTKADFLFGSTCRKNKMKKGREDVKIQDLLCRKRKRIQAY
jgi:hypothetical protein